MLLWNVQVLNGNKLLQQSSVYLLNVLYRIVFQFIGGTANHLGIPEGVRGEDKSCTNHKVGVVSVMLGISRSPVKYSGEGQ